MAMRVFIYKLRGNKMKDKGKKKGNKENILSETLGEALSVEQALLGREDAWAVIGLGVQDLLDGALREDG